MNKLTPEETARVFAMYWGQRIVTHLDTANPKGAPVCNALSLLTMGMFDIEKHRLLLTPLDKVTDNHAIELMKIEYPHICNGYETLRIKRNERGRVEIKFRYKAKSKNLDDGYSYSSWAHNFSNLTLTEWQQLLLWGYAVGMYFAPGHWANNETAISLGIAIDKTQINQTTEP
jgi:hypothetical protein